MAVRRAVRATAGTSDVDIVLRGPQGPPGPPGSGGGGAVTLDADGTLTVDSVTVELATDAALAGKADVVHGHAVADVTGLQGALDGKSPTGHAHSAADITSGTLPLARGGTGGTDAATARSALGLGSAALLAAGAASGDVPVLGAGGVLPIARVATGTPDGAKFVRDDGTLAVPAGGESPQAYSRAFTIQQPFAPARWLAGRISSVGNSAGMNAALNGTAVAVPYMATATATYDRIGIGAHSNGSAGSLIRLGIYADDGFFWPGSLLLDAGTVNGAAMTPVSSIVISQTLQAYTVYWLVMAFQGAPTTSPNIKASGSSASAVTALSGIGSSSQDELSNCSDSWPFVTGVTGALPASFPGRATVGFRANAPVITLRVA